MNLWKYYDGDLKYPDLTKHSHVKEVAKVTPRWAYEYAKKHGKDEELESIIAKNTEYSYLYAKHIKGHFKLGEPAIAKSAEYSYEYTNEVLKKDFYLDGKLICKYEG